MSKLTLRTRADSPRFTNKRYMIKTETLADHLFYMMEIALQLTKYIEFDLKEVSYRIMMHDLEEGVTLDIPRDIKHSSAEFKSMTDEIGWKILLNSGIINEDHLEDIKSAKSHDTLEGALTHFIDVYQAYLKLWDEVYVLNNLSVADDLNNDCLPYLMEVIDKISTEYPQCKVLQTLL